MPDQIRDVTRFSRYFNIEAPGSAVQAALFVILGITTGITATIFTHLHSGQSIYSLLLTGTSIGVLLITVPSILTVVFTKAMKRRIKLKHAFFAVLAISMLYACFILIDAMIFALTGDYTLAYIILILSNALIYGYWFLINRVVMNQKRSQVVTAAFQPMINVLLFIPLGRYLFAINIGLGPALIKLWSGMLVFMAIGYAILYTMDRPAKKALRISGVDLITAMVNQWLYDITKETEVFSSTGVKRDVKIKIIALRGRKELKAVFVSPDIHYGPFHEVGGGVATEQMGRKIEEQTGAVPFITHGAVSFPDNPVSTRQIHGLSAIVANYIRDMPESSFSRVKGTILSGRDGPCAARGIIIGNSALLTLTKAPMVTEDIDNSVGAGLSRLASGLLGNVLLIDAHNSRTESSNADELRGIYPGSKYVPMYEKAIRRMAAAKGGSERLRFGAYAEKIGDRLNRRDLGDGYTSVGVFQFGKKRFCMIYFDANNMLPSFREDVIRHVLEKFGADSEVYTTDTHSVNTIALPASNVLGRETKPGEMMPILDNMILQALGNVEEVSYAYSETTVKGFKVWGTGMDDILVKVGRDSIRAGKTKIPIIIAAGFIIAAWVIYLI